MHETQIPLFLSADAVALIQWARALPADGSRSTTYRPKQNGGLGVGEFTEGEALEFLGGKRGDKPSMGVACERWDELRAEIALHFVDGDPDNIGGHQLIHNFTWGCYKLTRAAEVVPDDRPSTVVAL